MSRAGGPVQPTSIRLAVRPLLPLVRDRLRAAPTIVACSRHCSVAFVYAPLPPSFPLCPILGTSPIPFPFPLPSRVIAISVLLHTLPSLPPLPTHHHLHASPR